MSVKRLVPLHAVALDTDPSGARIGDIYYNTTAIGAGAITGLLDHIHTYDGDVFSVEATEVPASGTVDGGTA